MATVGLCVSIWIQFMNVLATCFRVKLVKFIWTSPGRPRNLLGPFSPTQRLSKRSVYDILTCIGMVYLQGSFWGHHLPVPCVVFWAIKGYESLQVI